MCTKYQVPADNIEINKIWLISGFPPAFSHRGFHPLIWWQYVYEGGDADHHAHWSWGCLPAFSLPAGLWPPHGHHLPRLSRYAQAGVGRGSRQTHGQPRYRMPAPTHLPPHLHLHRGMVHRWAVTSPLLSLLYICAQCFHPLLITTIPLRFLSALEHR